MKDFYPFQFVTYMFMHDTHSLHMSFLICSGCICLTCTRKCGGPKRFLTFYLVTGIGAGIVQELVWAYSVQSFASANGLTLFELVRMDPSLNMMITIGASGSVFGILLAFAMLFPNVPLFLMFIPIPIKAKYFVVFYGLAELFMGVSSFGGDTVAHFAHLGGMLFGFFMVRYWKRKMQTMESIFTNLKNTFRAGNILAKLIYINVGLFILIRLMGVIFLLFNIPGISFCNICRCLLRRSC